MRTPYKELLTKQVQAIGRELIERAADLVGDGDLITDFYIRLNFPQDGRCPTIEVCREHIAKRAVDAKYGWEEFNAKDK